MSLGNTLLVEHIISGYLESGLDIDIDREPSKDEP
jgi:hypothetical protein